MPWVLGFRRVTGARKAVVSKETEKQRRGTDSCDSRERAGYDDVRSKVSHHERRPEKEDQPGVGYASADVRSTVRKNETGVAVC